MPQSEGSTECEPWITGDRKDHIHLLKRTYYHNQTDINNGYTESVVFAYDPLHHNSGIHVKSDKNINLVHIKCNSDYQIHSFDLRKWSKEFINKTCILSLIYQVFGPRKMLMTMNAMCFFGRISRALVVTQGMVYISLRDDLGYGIVDHINYQ